LVKVAVRGLKVKVFIEVLKVFKEGGTPKVTEKSASLITI
jgi:hypothetical protein